MEVVYREESYRIMGACFEVYREMGCGFLEPVYQECLELEFELQGLPFRPQADLILSYKGLRILPQGRIQSHRHLTILRSSKPAPASRQESMTF
jgi:hypothetical protein